MLGMILYETVDLVYNVSKITYNGVRGIYYWYYELEYPEQIEIEKRDALIIEIRERIKHLEELQGVATQDESTEADETIPPSKE